MARTRALDFEEKQRAILDYAAKVLATMGVDKASMSQIAGRPRISKALLYHYYPSKDALDLRDHLAHLQELDSGFGEGRRPWAERFSARLRLLVGIVLEHYRGADDRHKVQLNARAQLTEDQKLAITEVERRIVRRFAGVLRDISPRLDSKERPLLMPVTMSLFGMMNWMYMWFKDGGRISREDYAEVATAMILEGIKAVR